MSPRSAAGAYREASLEHAPPLKIVQLLYQGGLRFLEQAEQALGAGNSPRFQERCLRAQAIVAELRLALDPAAAPELAEELRQLYLFTEAEISRALSTESAAPLAGVREVLSTLLDGWQRLDVGAP